MRTIIQKYLDRLEEIRQEYPILHAYGDAWAMSLYEDFKKNGITEMLHTVPSTIVARRLKQKYHLSNSNVKVQRRHLEGDDFILVQIPFRLYKNGLDVKGLIKDMDALGWYPALGSGTDQPYSKFNLQTVLKVLETQGALIFFEPKYNSEGDKYMMYYHITPSIYVPKIDKIGLSPKNHGKLSQHPERVYLLNPTNLEDLIHVTELLYSKVKPEVKDKIEYMQIYGIKVSGLKNFKVYTDPNFGVGNGAVYTTSSIPPSNLYKVIKIAP